MQAKLPAKASCGTDPEGLAIAQLRATKSRRETIGPSQSRTSQHSGALDTNQPNL